jgi:hypothetical protein
MVREFCNGYHVTGNHGNTVLNPERDYHIEAEDGTVVGKYRSKREALAAAAKLKPGTATDLTDVVDAEFEPAESAVEETEATEEKTEEQTEESDEPVETEASDEQ